jgi:uncharacterized protein
VRGIADLPRRAALAAIRIYQRTLAPLLPSICRFEPSCSRYCAEAIERHGLLRGGWLGAKRLLRCQPLCKGGHDPVP